MSDALAAAAADLRDRGPLLTSADRDALADRLDVLAARLDHVQDVWMANMRGDTDAPDLIEAVGYLLSTDDPRDDPDPH